MPKKRTPSKSNSTVKNKKTINAYIALLLISTIVCLLLGFNIFIFQYKNDNVIKQISVDTVQHGYKSPIKEWDTIQTNDKDVLKLEKNSKYNIKPTIVAITSTTEESDVKSYTNRLVQGTLSTIPTLKLIENTYTFDKEVAKRKIVGYYSNASTRVDIQQMIYVKGRHVLTLTSSTDPRETKILSNEITEIFDSIFTEFKSK